MNEFNPTPSPHSNMPLHQVATELFLVTRVHSSFAFYNELHSKVSTYRVAGVEGNVEECGVRAELNLQQRSYQRKLRQRQNRVKLAYRACK